MKRLLILLFELTTLRKGPQDIPSALAVQQWVFGMYLLVNVALLQLTSSWPTVLLQLLVDLVLMAGFTWPLLYFAGHLARFPQTLTALLGADAIINFCALPALASLTQQPTEIGIFAMLLLMLWHWLVIGHIYRHALERPLLFTLALAFLYLMLSSQIMEALFPAISSVTPELPEQTANLHNS